MIPLPRYPTARSIGELLHAAHALLDALVDESQGEIVCDGGRVRFVDPCALAVFGAVADACRQRKHALRLVHFDPDVLAYLSRMDAFSGFVPAGAEHGQRQNRRDSLLEVVRVRERDRTDDVARRLVDSLVGRMDDLPNDDPPDEMTGMTRRNALEEPLEYMFTELLDNVFQHGRRCGFNASAWVCAQYYPASDLVRFAIVDNGCGFLKSLEEHPDLVDRNSHLAAIQLALRERVSGNPALLLRGGDYSANQGVGLTVVSRIVARAGGRMWIASGDACFQPGIGKMERVAPWQGCVLAVEVKRERLMDIRIHQVIATLQTPDSDICLDFS